MDWSIRLGVIAGLISAPFIFGSLLDFALGECFWETGCGRFENLWVLGLILASLLLAFLVAVSMVKMTRLFGR